MSLIVQKYGGSSMGSIERIGQVAERVVHSQRGGTSLVVVVSAMQGETDRLLGLAHAACARPDARETDQLIATGEQVAASLLAITLVARGIKAVSLTAAQMRLRTDGVFSRARILSLERRAIDEALGRGAVVVATGFQGIDDHGNLTTLGRGGSDTTAVALAAALRADECEIYTDVLGVYTADPNICPTARKIDVISFEEMLEMASLGAKVLQIRSVELAMNHKVPVRVRSTFSEDRGTLVTDDEEAIERLVVRGVSHNKNEVKVTLRHVPDQPGVAARVFTALALQHINVDVIVQNISEAGTTDLSFTVGRADRVATEQVMHAVARDIGARGAEVEDSIAKVSIIGVGMVAHPGVAATMFKALAAAGINIQMITTSEIKVTCVIDREQTERAVNALHAAFTLDRVTHGERTSSDDRPVARSSNRKASGAKAGPTKHARPTARGRR